MLFVNSLSQREANCILTAFHRLKSFCIKSEMCSHVYEKEFSAKHNTIIRDYDNTKCENVGVLLSRGTLLLSIQENIADIARNETYQKHLIMEFRNKMRDLGCPETGLYCESILMDFHKPDECSEYLTLALKLKLISYHFISYSFTELPTTVMKVMVEFLDYIAFHKFRMELFMSCIDLFTIYYSLDDEDEDDPLQSVLPKVLEVAHRLRINFFNLRFLSNPQRNHRKYVQHAFFVNVKRFLVFARYGYEDVCCTDADAIKMCLLLGITYNGFTIDNDICENFKLSSRGYRPLQVVVLYVLQTLKDGGYDKELCAKAIYVLWESIADPYMTEEYFMSSFVLYPVYSEAWKWYSRIVLRDAKPDGSSPRSLKHLARITTRRILTECVQFPFCVEFLDIPETLKKYLLLE